MTTSPISLPHARAGLGPVGASADGVGEPASEAFPVDVVVIGAGQAGLSAGYHLRRRGFVPAFGAGEEMTTHGEDDLSREGGAGTREQGAGTYVILDAEDGPGGAGRHRWASLPIATGTNI